MPIVKPNGEIAQAHVKWWSAFIGRWLWYVIAVICIVSMLSFANHFGSRTTKSLTRSELDNQSVSISESNERCCGLQWKAHSKRELSDAELYKMWVYPVRQEHERTLPFLKPVEIYGNPHARICIKAFYPFHRGHEHFKDYFKSLAERYYPHLRVECVNFGTPTGFKLFRKEGLSCGAVILQAHPQAKAKVGEVELPIVFDGPMDEAWQRSDLESLVRLLVSNESLQ